MARQGYHVAIGDIDREDVDAAVATLNSEGLSAEGHVFDVTQIGSVADAIARIEQRRPLWGLVNNAGIGGRRDLVDVDEDFFDRVISVNVKGVYFAMQAAVKAMLPRRRGAIVNVASTSGFISSKAPATVYDLSKGAVKSLTIAASRELARTGIRVNAVAPGTIETDLVVAARAANPDVFDKIEREIPSGRLGTPADIANAVCFLLSPASEYVLGHTLVVDGGWLT